MDALLGGWNDGADTARSSLDMLVNGSVDLFEPDVTLDELADDDADWEGAFVAGVNTPRHTLTVKVDGRLADTDRLQRAAADLVKELHWSSRYEQAVQCALEGNGNFGPVLNAIRRLVHDRHMRPVELCDTVIARRVWADDHKFSNTVHPRAYVNRSLPWPVALNLVRFLDGEVDEDTIREYLVDLYEHWYNRDSLVQQFSSFLMFVNSVLSTGDRDVVRLIVRSWHYSELRAS